jgi:DNA repair exonuclease SbcCD ATPase subunit
LNWIKKLFGKKEIPGEEASLTEIDFEDLPAWLDERSHKISSGMGKEVSGFMGKLEAALLELKESNSRLAEAKVEGDFDVRAVKRAKSNRENVTKQVAALIDKIKVQEDMDFKTLEGFYEAAVQNLETCLENMDRSFKYTRPVFPPESKDLSESLSRLSIAFKELRGAILENKTEIEAIEAAYSEARGIQNLSNSIKTEELDLESRERKIKALKDEIARASQELEEFRKGNAWQSLQNLQEEFNEAKSRLEKAEANVNSLVLPLSGHLSRIKKLHESGRYTLKPDLKHQLDICLGNLIHVDPAFFPELQKTFEDKALDMQTQKKEKALMQVRTLISYFPERKKEYLEALKYFETKNAEILEADTGKSSELEHKETELLSRTRLLEGDMENSKKKLVVLRGEIQNRREKLLTKINLIKGNLRLNFKH